MRTLQDMSWTQRALCSCLIGVTLVSLALRVSRETAALDQTVAAAPPPSAPPGDAAFTREPSDEVSASQLGNKDLWVPEEEEKTRGTIPGTTSSGVNATNHQVSAAPGKQRAPACENVATRRARPGETLVDSARCPVSPGALDAGVCVSSRDERGHHHHHHHRRRRRRRRRLSRRRRTTRCVPSLAVIGAMKSGTTNLMLYLSLHPLLRTSENRLGWPVESRFFSTARTKDDVEGKWREYLSRYPPRRGDDANGELFFDKSPNYVLNPRLPSLLAAFLPSLKLVATLRDPTRRAYSHFQHDCRNGRVVREAKTGRVRRQGFTIPATTTEEDQRAASAAVKRLSYPCAPDDFDAMIKTELAIARREYDGDPPDVSSWACRWSYRRGEGDSNVVARGFYACQLRRWLDAFPRDQLLVLVFESFVASRAATLDAVAAIERFVGVDAFDYDASWRVTAVETLYAWLPSRAGAYDPMLSHTKARLDDLYCQPNRDLAALLRRQDLPWPCVLRDDAQSGKNNVSSRIY